MQSRTIFRLSLVLLVLVLTACRGQAQPAPDTATATVPPPTPTASPTPTWTPSPTLTPTPSATPSPTPVPNITWENPWTGETLTISPRCTAPETQRLIAWMQAHPEDFLAQWQTYWQQYYEDNPQIVELLQLIFEDASFTQWYADFWDQPSLVVAEPAEGETTPSLLINFTGLTLGLAERIDYPDLGLTVFTVCALLYDSDLYERVYSLDDVPPVDPEIGGSPLLRPDPEQAQPHWYVGQIPVAFVVWPDGFLASVPAAEAHAVSFSLSGQGSYGEHDVSVTYAPGCYYLDMVLDLRLADWQTLLESDGLNKPPTLDAECSRLAEMLNFYDTYVATVRIMHAFTADEPYSSFSFFWTPLLDDLNFDLAVADLSDPETLQDMAYDFLYSSLTETDTADSETEPEEFAAQVAQTALPYVAWLWQEHLGREQCTPTRALTYYKLKPELRPMPCDLSDAPPGFWPAFYATEDLLSGSLGTIGELRVETVQAWAEQP